MNPYIGHASQLGGAEMHRLVGGKGDGMRLLELRNGLGLEMTLCPDRALDISRLLFKGVQMSYMSPCGYVAPAYYESTGTNWLKSFTAGFLTTCGLQAVGSPCQDAGEELPLHGAIAHQPCEQVSWEDTAEGIRVRARILDETIFGRKLALERTLLLSRRENAFTLTDRIENTGDRQEPLEILYHMNMGYPLLSEESLLRIPSCQVTPRDAHAAEDLAHWMHMQPPTPGFQERCYYHRFPAAQGTAAIFQPRLGMGLEISFNAETLDGFVEWKMMGVRDYVLGLECGNCYPDGRDVMRRTGMLKFLAPGETKEYSFTVRMLEHWE